MSEQFIRSLVADRAGGATFDQSGSHVFSAMIKAENDLEESSVEGEPTTAVLRFSVADPVFKMDDGNFTSGVHYFDESPDASRYTDLGGIRNFDFDGQLFGNTQECLAHIINEKYLRMKAGHPMTSDMVQYTYDGIKGPLSTHIPATFFDENTVVWMPDPSYGVIAAEVNRMGAKVVKIPIWEDAESGKHFLRTMEIDRAFDKSSGAKHFLYLNVPHNPTGFVFTAEYWEDILEWARENDVMLIVDEAYIDLDYSGVACSILEIPGWSDNAIVLQSVSKAHGATGLRFGWICSNPIAIKAIRNTIDSKNSGLFGPCIEMGLQCLADQEGQDRMNKKYRDLHSLLSDALLNTGLTEKSSVPEAGLCQLTEYPRTATLKTNPTKVESVVKHEFATATDFANWLRQELRISVMPQDSLGKIRWAVTFRPESRYGFTDEESVLQELLRRLDLYEYEI